MEIINNYNQVKNIDSGKIELDEIIFMTKEKFEKELEIQEYYYMIEELVDDESGNNELYVEFLKKCDFLDEKSREKILLCMIGFGSVLSFDFKDTFNIKISDFPLELFIEGIKNGGYDLVTDYNFKNYLNLYKNPDKLHEIILEEGYIDIYFYLKLENVEKIEDELLDKYLQNYTEKIKSFKLDDKIYFLGNNWLEIFNNFSNNPIKYLEKIRKMVYLSEKEKEFLEQEKKSKYLAMQKENINQILEKLEIEYFSILDKVDINITEDNNSKLEELRRKIIFKNNFSDYQLIFIDLLGREDFIILSENKEKYLYKEKVFSKKDFLKKMEDLFEYYNYDLEKNNVDFTIILLKDSIDTGPFGGGEEFELPIAA